MTKPYNDFSTYFKKLFSDRVQKISVDAGFTCPNRDGTKSSGGCTYCNNDTFNPFYCTPQKTVKQQLTEGIEFFSKKYKTQKYLAYFQAYSNTYADLSVLKNLYNEALETEGVIGLVIATRPDCIDEEKLNFIQELAKKYYILLEYGVESTNNESLNAINRAHTFEDSIRVLEMTKGRNITTGIHLIFGLPFETRQTMLKTAEIISSLPFDTLKMHQLQIVKGTKMARDYAQNPENFKLFSAQEYISFIADFLELLNPKIIVERFIAESPVEYLIAPHWGGLKNFEIIHKIESLLLKRNSFQGKYFCGN